MFTLAYLRIGTQLHVQAHLRVMEERTVTKTLQVANQEELDKQAWFDSLAKDVEPFMRDRRVRDVITQLTWFASGPKSVRITKVCVCICVCVYVRACVCM